MSVNKAILVGRLGRDPETRFTSGGQAVANFTLATDETFKDRSGERQKRTEWHRIVLWGKLAEITQQYLKKGMLVYIEGRMQTSRAEGAAAGASAASAAPGGRAFDPDAEGGGGLPDEVAGPGPEISDE